MTVFNDYFEVNFSLTKLSSWLRKNNVFPHLTHSFITIGHLYVVPVVLFVCSYH